jgi:hypothetical protein
VHSERRFHPVTEGALDAAGAARCGTPRYHLQAHRHEAKLGLLIEFTSRGEGELMGMDC